MFCPAINLTNFFPLDFGPNIHEIHIRMIFQQANSDMERLLYSDVLLE
jgi:hypothetical protein